MGVDAKNTNESANEEKEKQEPMISGVCVRCGLAAALQCPKCRMASTSNVVEPHSLFCSQDCFKFLWKEHKAKYHPPPPPPPTSSSSSQQDSEWGYAIQRGRGRCQSMPGFSWTGTLRPFPVGKRRHVPPLSPSTSSSSSPPLLPASLLKDKKRIPQPDWADNPNGRALKEEETKFQRTIPLLRSEVELRGIRETCLLARELLDLAHRMVRPGATTDSIDSAVHDATIAAGAYPSPLNYYNFPKSCCTSVNEVVCHGIPDSRPLVEGDIVNVDITCYLNGYHGDINETFTVGKVSEERKKLIQVTHECLEKAIAACKPGMRFRDLGELISKHAKDNKFSVVKTYCGHGIGKHFHCAPNIPHYSKNKAVGVMKPGMVFTIEPMINEGTWRDTTWPDGWTSVTEDGKCSAQFEHTMIVTDNGVDVLTKRLSTSPPLCFEE